MTETRWLASDDWRILLRSLESKGTDRKLRLFSVECCRLVSRFLKSSEARNAFRAIERFADGETSWATISGHRLRIASVFHEADDRPEMAVSEAQALMVVDEASYEDSYLAARRAAAQLFNMPRCPKRRKAELVGMIRDIFGNPFRPIQVDPGSLSTDVLDLAKAIYDERDFDRMPILGDALEERGCTNSTILDHCRQQWTHVRGCWLVDSILGKS